MGVRDRTAEIQWYKTQAALAYVRNMDPGQIHTPSRPGEDRVAWNGSVVRVLNVESEAFGVEFGRTDSGLVVQLEPREAKYLRCKSCHWDFWFDPAASRTERPYTLEYCEWCHGVVDKDHHSARYVPVMTNWDRAKIELETIRGWLASIGMLGLFILGGMAITTLLIWILDVLGV